ncbi:MAG TPA: lipid-binding SYLF domain-containing protein [Sphingobacteriaceae bacterium]
MKQTHLLKKSAMLLLGAFWLATGSVKGQEKEENKIVKSTEIVVDFNEMNELIPAEIVEQSQGIIIIPKMINAGFGVGGKRGKGVAMVRNSDGSWSDPVFVTMTGGSIGFQAGVQAIDLVLLFKDRQTLTSVKKGTFTLGGGVSVAAGPVGRSAGADTDYKMEAEVYSYSRTKGLFAGVSLNGTAIELDEQATSSYYGKGVSSGTIFSGSSTQSENAAVEALKEAVSALYQ